MYIICLVGYQPGRQKIIDRMVAGIPGIYPPLISFMKAILIFFGLFPKYLKCFTLSDY
jgi:hypothetical protein